VYTSHSEVVAPADRDILWRYFDLARYLDLLIREQLFFARTEEMEDPNEELGFNMSSWHNSEEESYAMWKIYAQGTAGLAIQTTFARLRQAFHATDKPIWIGKVAYYSEKHGDGGRRGLRRYLQKRSVYSYEKEVRCCYKPQADEAEQELCGSAAGVYIGVDLDQLIERVYISPYAPRWFRELIVGINKKFGVEKEIVHSGVLG
jgi:hypothetical protein